MKRKFVSMILITLLLNCIFPISVFAAAPTKQTEQTAAASISLEKAIQNVKQIFTIPANMKDFSSSFDSSNDRQIWRLEWSDKEKDTGNFVAEVDAISGEIWAVHRWSQNEDAFSKTPTLTVLEARQKGQKYLNQLLPHKASDFQFQDENSIIPLGSYDSPKYSMVWQRTYKGIKVAMDTVNMTIDMQTGEITDYSLNWTSKALPNPDGAVSVDKASQVFASQEMLKLQYLIDNNLIKGGVSSKKPQLIYGIRHASNGMIDAFSGQPLTTGGGYVIYDKAGMGNGKFINESAVIGAPVPLSPEETKEIENTSKYLTKEEAVSALKNLISFPAAMVLDSASLQKNWQDENQRIWSLNFRSESNVPEKYAYLWAQINASTGELISFNSDASVDNNTPKTISKKDAQQLAEVFIRKVQLKHWSEIKMDDMNSPALPLNEMQTNWSFNYLRLVNGILCPQNGIYISVDANRNQVVGYSMNWNSNSFPSASKAISREQANTTFLKLAPMVLSYVQVADTNGQQSIKLVYLPDQKNGMSMLDAITGAALDGSGQPISNNPQANHFQDIKGHFGEKEISLLGQSGMFGEYGNNFHPDENVSLISLLRAMLTAKEGIYSTQGVSDKEIIQRCQRLGWVDENQAPQNQVSREMLAQLMIRFLNIDYLSEVQGIYQVPYQDAAGMSAATKAYAALCWGLGIIKSDGRTFNAGHITSRAEAAIALAHVLSIKTHQ